MVKMPFACVKFSVSCPRHPLQSSVNVSSIINYSADLKKNKLYHVKCGASTCLGKIAYVCGISSLLILRTFEEINTLQEVEKAMSRKRSVVPPNKFVDSASDVESVIQNNASSSRGKSSKKGKWISSMQTVEVDLHDIKKNAEYEDDYDSNEEVDVSGLDTTGEQTSGLDTSGEQTSGWDTTGEQTSALSPKDNELNRITEENEILKLENVKLKNFNFKLQTILCNEFGVITIDTDKENDAQERVHMKVHKSVGFINKIKDMIHLGCDIWIPCKKWNCVVINSNNSASLFARNLTRCLYSEEVLKKSSITGRSLNRASIKKTEALDPTRITAIQSAFQFWATKQLVPPFNDVNVQRYKNCIPTFVGKFCDDLRQPPEKWRKKKHVGNLTEEQKIIEKKYDDIISKDMEQMRSAELENKEKTQIHKEDSLEIREKDLDSSEEKDDHEDEEGEEREC